MPIVKANAYGHGIIEVARHLVTLGATSLGAAFLEEAVTLREAGITFPSSSWGASSAIKSPCSCATD